MSIPAPEKVDLSKYIELRNNRPHIRGRRLPVAFIAAAHRENKLTTGELAYQFTLSEEEILAALLYYREHQAEIEAQDKADTQESLEMHEHWRATSKVLIRRD